MKVLIKEKVKDHAKWQSALEGNMGQDLIKKSGMTSYQCYHSEEDPNQIFTMLEWKSSSDAHRYFQDCEQQIQTWRQEAGVVGQPDIFYLEEDFEKNV